MRAQEFCSPSLQPSLRCKTHAFLPPRTPSFRQLILTPKSYPFIGTIPSRQLYRDTNILPVYRDFAILTILSLHDNSCPFTRTLLSRQLHHDTKTPTHLPGLYHLDNFAWTRNRIPASRNFTKPNQRQLALPNIFFFAIDWLHHDNFSITLRF
jgi:hypothetical protein